MRSPCLPEILEKATSDAAERPAGPCMGPSGKRPCFPPATGSRRPGAVALLMALLLTIETPGGECAFGVHVVTSKAVEALADQVGRHRPSRHRNTPPVPSALHWTETLSIWLDRHAGRVNHNGGKTLRCWWWVPGRRRRASAMNPPRRGRRCLRRRCRDGGMAAFPWPDDDGALESPNEASKSVKRNLADEPESQGSPGRYYLDSWCYEFTSTKI